MCKTLEIINATTYYKNVEVKNCPFCGEEKEIYLEQYEHRAGPRWKIFCGNCAAGINRGFDQTPYGLIEAWNKRSN